MCLESPNIPRRVLAESLDRAKYWTPWPALLDSPQVLPIEEPPDEAEEVLFTHGDDPEDEQDEPDEVELSACPGKHTIDPYDRYCFYCGFDREAAR